MNKVIYGATVKCYHIMLCNGHLSLRKLYNESEQDSETMNADMKQMEDPKTFKTMTKEWVWENIPSY